MEEPYSSNSRNLSLSAAASSPRADDAAAAAAPLDYDVAVILAAMVCALVCALGLNSMLQCVLRCTRRTLAGPAVWVASRRLNCGLKREALVALPVSTYSSSSSAAAASSPLGCPICLSDFSDGDRLRVLPACSHRFHVGCIDTWLLSHCSCPTCRSTLPGAAKTNTRCGGSDRPPPPPPLQIVTAA